MREWFYANDGVPCGPFPEDEIRRLLLERTLTPDTLVWSAAWGGAGTGWVRAADTDISAFLQSAVPSRAASRKNQAGLPRRKKIIIVPAVCACAVIIAAVIFMVWEAGPLRADDFFALCGEGTAEEIISALKDNVDPRLKPSAPQGSISTPLIAAILNEKIKEPEVISAFAKSGADLNARDGDSGFTALMYAAAAGKLDMLRELAKAGADVNACDSYGCTAIMYAITGNQREAVSELIRCGANVNARDSLGRPAFSLALNPSVDSAIAAELIKNGANVNESVTFRDEWRVSDVSLLMLAIINMCGPEIINALIENGADVNAETRHGDTALMFAITKNGDPATAIRLIESGANLNKKYFVSYGAPFQYTALMWAIIHRNDIEVLRAMIRRGSDVNARTSDGPTALDCAKYESYEAAITLLKRNGAK